MGLSNLTFFAWNLFRSFDLILRNKSQISKTRLFLTYLKVKFKYLLSVKLLKRNPLKEKMFGLVVRFHKYTEFFCQFEEIFINSEYFFEAQSNSPSIIDGGSNMGMSVLYFKTLYPDAKITAFEPDKNSFELLRTNVEANNLKDVLLVNKALYHSEQTLSFYNSPDIPAFPHGSLIKERRSDICESKIKTVPLSQYINKETDFAKIDIEGAEEAVIKELSEKTKLRLVKKLIIEYHHHINPEKDCLSALLKTLEDNGFGYQINSYIPSFRNKRFQDIYIYAYRK